MKSYLLATALVLVALATGFSLHSVQPASDTVTFPIEVMGPDGHTVTVQVNASTVSDVQALYVKAHSIGYPYHIAEGRGFQVDKASIRLNGGAWYDVNTQSVSCLSPEATIRCIEGPAHTVRFRILISKLGSLNDGANTVSFRFNYAHPSGELPANSTGYRILDLQLQTGGGADRIDGTTFVWDDPGAWTAPDGYDTSADVQKGQGYWSSRNLLVDGWGGPEITASCADCHVQNGYDLQYFAYSNESIIQRSRFHGLTGKQGKQIAAYIRSLDVKTEGGRTIDPPGRPWNPPYQPGLTSAASRPDGAPRNQGQSIDDMAPIYWAAGAGIEWALDSDREMKPFLFPNGITPSDMQVQLNTRELPVALQMPDWNEWLPAVHPMDVWDREFTSSKAWDRYTNDMQDAHDTGNLQDVIWAMEGLWKEIHTDWRRRTGPGTFNSNPDKGVAGLGVFQWALTKTFELVHPNHFENDAQDFYGPGAEPLQWPGNSRIVFDQAPHILGAVKGAKSGVMDLYHDTAWYQHAMTLNPGSSIGTGLKPLDWKYHYAHLSAIQQYGAHSFRYLYAYAKLLQVAETVPEENDRNEPKGYYMRHLTPGVIDLNHIWAQFIDQGLTDDEYRRAANVLLKTLGEGLSDEPFENWKRKRGNRGLDDETSWPQMMGQYDTNSYHSHFWTALHNFGEAGAAYEVLKPLAEWAQVAWPRRD